MKADEHIIQNSPFAWWEWNIVANTVDFNDLKASMLGYDPRDFRGAGYQKFTELLHPDDYNRTMEAMMSVLRGEVGLYQTDYRIRAADGSYRWYMDRGTVIEFGEDRKPVIIRGIVIDLGREAQAGSGAAAIIKLMSNSSYCRDGHNELVFTVCSNCRKVKVDADNWIPVSEALRCGLSDAVSHGICPDCVRALYPDLADEILTT